MQDGNVNPMIINGSLRKFDPGVCSSFETDPGVYDVVRVIEGVPLFLEDHLDRLERSARLSNFSIDLSRDEIVTSLLNLIEIIGSGPYSVKLIFSHPDHNEGAYCIMRVPRKTPTPEEYTGGVSTRIVHLSRLHPQIKEINRGYNDRVQKEITEDHVFEILLVDEHNRITEGGKSNVFFVDDDTLITPPRYEVLPGITRNKILNLAGDTGIPVFEREVFFADLETFDAVLLTGTSIFVLPVARIDGMEYPSADHRLVRSLLKGYQCLTEEYVASFRKKSF